MCFQSLYYFQKNICYPKEDRLVQVPAKPVSKMSSAPNDEEEDNDDPTEDSDGEVDTAQTSQRKKREPPATLYRVTRTNDRSTNPAGTKKTAVRCFVLVL